MKFFGWFEDLPHGWSGEGRISAVVNMYDGPAQILDYMRGASALVVSGTATYDVLSNDRVPTGWAEMVTDGTWAWPSDLAYYVERYKVALPAEFVAHAQSLGWTPPELSESQVMLLGDDVQRSLGIVD